MTRASFRQCRQFARVANPFYELLRSDSINGFAIGRKIVQGKTTADLAITVFVKRKLSLRRLPLARRSPQILRLPDDGAPDGVLDFITDVQEATFHALTRSEEHTSELQSLMRISYAVFC